MTLINWRYAGRLRLYKKPNWKQVRRKARYFARGQLFEHLHDEILVTQTPEGELLLLSGETRIEAARICWLRRNKFTMDVCPWEESVPVTMMGWDAALQRFPRLIERV